MAVHRKLGPGYREDTYQRDLATHLTESHLEIEEQKLYEVHDNAISGGLIGYLAATRCPIGLLFNFGERSLKYRRVLPPLKISDFQANRQWLFVPDWLKGEEEH
jgi:hypothetical protein